MSKELPIKWTDGDDDRGGSHRTVEGCILGAHGDGRSDRGAPHESLNALGPRRAHNIGNRVDARRFEFLTQRWLPSSAHVIDERRDLVKGRAQGLRVDALAAALRVDEAAKGVDDEGVAQIEQRLEAKPDIDMSPSGIEARPDPLYGDIGCRDVFGLKDHLRPTCGQCIGKQPPLLIELGFIGALRQSQDRQHDAAACYRQDYRDRDQLADP